MLLTVPFPVLAEAVGHVPAVLAALLVLVLLVLLAVLYVQCRLNVLLWYRDRYGELEINGEPEVFPLGTASHSLGAHTALPMLSLLCGSPQMGSSTMPTSPTPLPPMTESSSTSL